MNKEYLNYQTVITDSPDNEYDCTTGEKFTARSKIRSIDCKLTDEPYFMDEENIVFFKTCYTDYHLTVWEVKNNIKEVSIAVAAPDYVKIAYDMGYLED